MKPVRERERPLVNADRYMEGGRRLPDDTVASIRRCVGDRKIYWTYHVNMRLAGPHLTREEVVGAAASYEIIEARTRRTSICRANSSGRRQPLVRSTFCSAPTWKATTCES